MHRVAFFVYLGFELLDMAGPASVFDGANHVLSQCQKPQFYAVDLVSTKGGPVTSSSGVAVHSLRPGELARRTVDTLLMVGAQRERLLPALGDPRLRTWLPKLVSRVPRFGSVCSGAFILAALGMLDGRRAATHWGACASLAKESPAHFVESVRLETARALLSQGRQLKAVAAEVGLPPARLRLAFERRFGLAPRLFREMHAEK